MYVALSRNIPILPIIRNSGGVLFDCLTLCRSTTASKVIGGLLARFNIDDNPQKFALYEHTIFGENEGKTFVFTYVVISRLRHYSAPILGACLHLAQSFHLNGSRFRTFV